MNYNARLIEELLDGSIDINSLTPRLIEELLSLARIGARQVAQANGWRVA